MSDARNLVTLVKQHSQLELMIEKRFCRLVYAQPSGLENYESVEIDLAPTHRTLTYFGFEPRASRTLQLLSEPYATSLRQGYAQQEIPEGYSAAVLTRMTLPTTSSPSVVLEEFALAFLSDTDLLQ